MSSDHKAILEKANAAIAKGDNEGFLSCCTDDAEWTFVGDKTLRGKEAVRRWMATTYTEPPKFMITNLIAEGDFVTALGNLTIKDEDGARRPITRTATFGDFATVRWLNYDLSL